MADNRTWEFGASPEGPGERAYALGNLFKKERALKSIEKRDRMGEMEAQHGYRLAEMMAGKQYDEQAKEREAQASVGALRRMIEGNKGMAQGLGYGPGPDTISRQGAMAEPEAMGIQAPITPGVAPRPTDQELRGLARPSMLQAIAQHAMPKAPEPYNLGEGQVRFDPQNRPVAAGPPKPQRGGFDTPDQVQAEISRLEKANPQNVGRYTSHQDPLSGKHLVNLSQQTSLAENPTKWIAEATDPNLTPEQRRLAQQRLEIHYQREGNLAGLKAGQTSWQTIRPDEVLQSKQNIQRATNLDMMMAYPDPKINAFLGLRGESAKAEQILANLPGGTWLMAQYRKDPQAFLREAAEFQQLAAFDTKYVLSRIDGAGGTMTVAEEKRIIAAFAGAARNPIEFRARAKAHQALLRAENDLATYRQTTPDPRTFNATSEMFFKSRLEKYAPGFLARGVNALLPSGNDLRQEADRK